MAAWMRRFNKMHEAIPTLNKSFSSHSSKTYYDVLGVPRSASSRDIKIAFLQLTKQHHPDLNPNQPSDKMAEINEAYGILGNPSKRQHYNHKLRMAGSYGRSMDYSDNNVNRSDYKYHGFPDVEYNVEYKSKNARMAGLLIIVMIIGSCVQAVRIYWFRSKLKRRADLKDKYNKEIYESVVAKANNVSVSQQLEELKHKYSGNLR